MPWFKKEMPETPLFLPVGKPIRFEAVDFDYGYLQTEDGYIVTELRKCVARKVGGVTEITQEEYEEFAEKKGQGPLLLNLQRQRQSIGPQKRTQSVNSSDVVAVSNRAEVVGRTADGRMVSDVATPQRSNGLQVNKQFSKPRIGKIPVTDD
jgi:hypothetical protein